MLQLYKLCIMFCLFFKGGFMAEKVKLSKDGNSIDFSVSENIPTSLKKFRQSPDIEGFYRFIYENDLQKEVYDILDRIITTRKAAKSTARKEAKAQAAAVAASMKAAANPTVSVKNFREDIVPVKTVKPAATAKTQVSAKPTPPQSPKSKPAKPVSAKPATKLQAKAQSSAKAKPAAKAKKPAPSAKTKKASPKKK